MEITSVFADRAVIVQKSTYDLLCLDSEFGSEKVVKYLKFNKKSKQRRILDINEYIDETYPIINIYWKIISEFNHNKIIHTIISDIRTEKNKNLIKAIRMSMNLDTNNLFNIKDMIGKECRVKIVIGQNKKNCATWFNRIR